MRDRRRLLTTRDIIEMDLKSVLLRIIEVQINRCSNPDTTLCKNLRRIVKCLEGMDGFVNLNLTLDECEKSMEYSKKVVKDYTVYDMVKMVMGESMREFDMKYSPTVSVQMYKDIRFALNHDLGLDVTGGEVEDIMLLKKIKKQMKKKIEGE